jgi:hypothetical protein
MSSELTPYAISEFKSGLNTYLQPWIRPADAFDPLVNAYVYRGTINTRAGYTQIGNRLADRNPVMGIMNWINQTTGFKSLLVATTVNLYLYNEGANTFGTVTSPPTFTGNITNFFNFTNWQPVVGGSSFLYMVNDRNNITTFNGTAAASLVPVIDGSGTTITTCLDVQVYKERLLAIRPTLSTGGTQNQSIYWSAISRAANADWRIDVAGQGGFLAAPTGDVIQSVEFVRDFLVVFFTNSTWIFRYTGNDTSPFRWDKLNDSKNTRCPYGSISYDERCTAIGNSGLIACDGVNVQRYDIPIVDYYQTYLNQSYLSQAFAQRYDNLNQGWMLYVSNGFTQPLVGGVAPASDKALIYNFVENTWATYDFSSNPLTCLGTFRVPSTFARTWASYTQSWDVTDQPWKDYSAQSQSLALLAGDPNGYVWFMDNRSVATDNGNPIVPDIVSTRWNPSVKAGEKLQFCHIDIYYQVVSTDPDNPVQVTLNFYTDNSENIAASKILTLDGPVQGGNTFKRIYVNLVGEFIQMEIDPNVDALMRFNGFILWVRPAGRLTGP